MPPAVTGVTPPPLVTVISLTETQPFVLVSVQRKVVTPDWVAGTERVVVGEERLLMIIPLVFPTKLHAPLSPAPSVLAAIGADVPAQTIRLEPAFARFAILVEYSTS